MGMGARAREGTGPRGGEARARVGSPDGRASRPTATGPRHGARRRDEDIAPYRHGIAWQIDRAMRHRHGIRAVRTTTGHGGAHGHGIRAVRTTTRRCGASREPRRASIAPDRNGTAWQMDRVTGTTTGRGHGTVQWEQRRDDNATRGDEAREEWGDKR